MKVLGIIAEYNPFHNGHKYHLEQSLKKTGADVTVAVMSGNFTQRGEPALINKWIRSELAVRNGIDLVLELPFVFACNNADIFSYGGINLLDSLGCVDYLSFGSEEGSIDNLSKIASFLEFESEEFALLLKEKMKEGKSYPVARAEAISILMKEEVAGFVGVSKLLQSPNNILGIEYLKWLSSLDSDIEPVTIPRHGANVDGINHEMSIAGATAIREMIVDGDIEGAYRFLTDESKLCMSQNIKKISDSNSFEPYIKYSIISKSAYKLSNIYSITEGLENKVKSVALEAETYEEMVDSIKSKRYTETRIKRILIHSLMNLTREKMDKILKDNQMYGRVLAFNKQGASLLKNIKKEECSRIPIITNISKESNLLKNSKDVFDYDMLATDVYNLALDNNLHDGSDYRQIPAYVGA